MPIPSFDKQKKQKARKTRLLVFALLLAVIGLFGGIYLNLRSVGSLKTMLPGTNPTTANSALPITPAPLGDLKCPVNYDDLTPYFFHEKLIYCDPRYRCHVKTEIDANKISFADQFSDGLARIGLKGANNSESIIYIGKNGKIEVQANPNREISGPFSDGLAFAVEKSSRKLGFIDKHGKFAITPRFYLASSKKASVSKEFQLQNCVLASGLAPVYSEKVNALVQTPSCGYIDRSGKFLIASAYLKGSAFVEGRARILVKDEKRWRPGWGFIDPHGIQVIKPIYMEANNFSEGSAAVLDYQDRWGYIGKDGKYVIAPKFSDAEPFSEKLAAVANEKKQWGYIHPDGSWLIQPRFDKADPFEDGEAHASIGDPSSKLFEDFWINSAGKIERHRRKLIPIEIEDVSNKAN